MSKYKLKGLGNDTEVKFIGTLFKRNNAKKWLVNVAFKNSQIKPLPMSITPVLARKRVFNSSSGEKRHGYDKILTIADTTDWQTKRIKDCPIKLYEEKKDKDQFCFVFHSNDMDVYLPQFELARALFFHDAYLARTAIEPDCLGMEFDVNIDQDQDEALINVMPHSGFSSGNLNNPGSRNILSWILLDQEARRSYESIGKYQKIYGENITGGRFWRFQFDPPLLQGVKLKVRGHFDSLTNSFFIYEIDNINNLKANLPSKIEFTHPNLNQSVRGGGKSRTAGKSCSSEEFVIDDEFDANSVKNKVAIPKSSVGIHFRNSFTTKVVRRTQAKVSGGAQKDESDNNMALSMEEATSEHGLHGADWTTQSESELDPRLFKSKFSCFFDMVDELVANYGYILLSKEPKQLPNLARCKKHYLSTDGSPRYMAVVQLGFNNRIFHVLEVDTSDNEKSLSTRVMLLPDLSNADYPLKVIMQLLLKSSLSWPIDYLDHICGAGNHKGISHPRTTSKNKGVMDPESVSGWAARFNSWMVRMC